MSLDFDKWKQQKEKSKVVPKVEKPTDTKVSADIKTLEVLPFSTIPIDVMLNRFIHPAAKMRDPGLTVEKIDNDIYTFPLFTEEFCQLIIIHAEQVNKWTKKRHKFYPTTDILLQNLGLKDFYNKVIERYVMYNVKYYWNYEYKDDSVTSEDFLVRYKPSEQAGLGIHNDAAMFSFVISLNTDYKGGGTKFARQNIIIDAPVGYATMHPSRLTHPHGGIPIIEGTRYILVSFCEYNKYKTG
jgi:hypothetical protein